MAGEKVAGPFTAQQLKQLASQGKLTSAHRVSADRKRWFPPEKVQGLMPQAASPPPESEAPPAYNPLFDELLPVEASRKASSAASRERALPPPYAAPKGAKPYIEVLTEEGEVERCSIADVRRRLLEGSLTRHDLARWIEPPPAGSSLTGDPVLDQYLSDDDEEVDDWDDDDDEELDDEHSRAGFGSRMAAGGLGYVIGGPIGGLVATLVLLGASGKKSKTKEEAESEAAELRQAVSEWERRRKWRKIGEGLAKDYHRIGVLYNPASACADYGSTIVAVLAVIAYCAWLFLGGLETAQRIGAVLGIIVAVVAFAATILLGSLAGAGIGWIFGRSCGHLLPRPPEDGYQPRKRAG
jgi:hypothetical protein